MTSDNHDAGNERPPLSELLRRADTADQEPVAPGLPRHLSDRAGMSRDEAPTGLRPSVAAALAAEARSQPMAAREPPFGIWPSGATGNEAASADTTSIEATAAASHARRDALNVVARAISRRGGDLTAWTLADVDAAYEIAEMLQRRYGEDRPPVET
jgi:hypothetical protein